jgi:hypothetical protein
MCFAIPRQYYPGESVGGSADRNMATRRCGDERDGNKGKSIESLVHEDNP